MEFGTFDNPWPLTVSALESWRHFNSIEREVEPSEILDSFFGEFKETANSLISKAVHAWVAHQMDPERRSVGVAGFTIAMSPTLVMDFEAAKGVDISIDKFTWLEGEFGWKFDTGAGWVDVRGKTDGVDGSTIVAFKTSAKQFKTMDYINSLSWKVALAAIPEAVKFQYRVMQFACGPSKGQKIMDGRLTRPTIPIVDYVTFDLYRYSAMEEDAVAGCRDIVEWLKRVDAQPARKKPLW